MTVYADRVKEQTTTTGTGNLTLTGAVTGFQSFSAALGTGRTMYYGIEEIDGSGVPSGGWEVGIGNLSNATTLVRDIILSSSNSGAVVDLAAGTKNVWCNWPAQEAQTSEVAFDLVNGTP